MPDTAYLSAPSLPFRTRKLLTDAVGAHPNQGFVMIDPLQVLKQAPYFLINSLFKLSQMYTIHKKMVHLNIKRKSQRVCFSKVFSPGYLGHCVVLFEIPGMVDTGKAYPGDV